MSTVLLVATTLFVRSLWNAGRIDPGFDMAHVVTIEADTRSRQLTAAEVGAYYRTAIERLKDVPNVVAVSGAIVVPLSMNSIVNSLLVDIGGKDQVVTVNTNRILPDYFRAMGIPLRSGREFSDSDRAEKPRVAIVNETFARRLFPGQSALGQRVRRPASDGNFGAVGRDRGSRGRQPLSDPGGGHSTAGLLAVRIGRREHDAPCSYRRRREWRRARASEHSGWR